MPREQAVPEHVKTKSVTIKDFNDLSKADLTAWEMGNRQSLMSAPVDVVYAFADKWERTTGTPYFKQSAAPENDILDPRATNYCVPTRVKAVRWVKDKMKRGSADAPYFDEVYNLDAITFDGGIESILRGATVDQVPIYTNDEIAAEILGTKVSKKNGEVACDITLPLMGYWEVRFQPKRNPDDTEEVFLASSGVCLQIEREVNVVLRGAFLESADNGTYPVFKQEPGEDRKVVGRVSFYPYTARRRATRKEYEKMLAEGNKLTRKAREDRAKQGKNR